MKNSHFSSNYDFSSRQSGATSSSATIYHERTAHHFHKNLNCDSDVTIITSSYPNSTAVASSKNTTNQLQHTYHNNSSIASNNHLERQTIKYEPLNADSVDAEQTEHNDEYHIIRSTNKYHYQSQQLQQQSAQKGTSSKRKRESG